MNQPAAGTGDRLRHGREMAFNRLAFASLITLYFAAVGSRTSLLVVMFSYLCFSAVLWGWLRWPRTRALDATIVCALITDLAVLSLCMHLDGPGNAALFPLYLWTIQGNGFRLGIRPLFIAMTAGLAGFAAVIATTPFWRQQPALGIGLLATILVLPVYSAALIRKLSRARLLAEEASRSKSMFLAAISHELRTPLNAILGSVSLVEATPLDTEQRSLFEATRTGTQSLLSLIGSILDFSRLEAGLMPMTYEAVDLAALLAEIRDLVAIQARLKSLQLSFHAGPDVPLRFTGNRKHLLEVLLNLMANAVKFTETGSVCLSVDLAPGEAPLLCFEVSDTGIGIAREAQARIFDVFVQADPSILDRFGGTGLGLAISQQLVTRMGGSMGVESRPGRGSSFRFTVALAPAEADIDIPPPQAALLVCDDPALVAPLTAALGAWCATVRAVAALPRLPRAEAGGAEILFLYRRDPARDLPADCALLGRQDPLATMPRILLTVATGPAPPAALPRRHFLTTLAVGPGTAIDEPALARACRLAAAMTGHPAAPTPTVTAYTAAPRPLHVLVADDNDTNQRVVRKILERAGHQVGLASDGAEALDAMEADRFDLVLMDVNMPGMNGLEATRLFRLAMPPGPRLPILALTADATIETERKCHEAGMDGCITKPVTPARLVAIIDAQFADAAVPARMSAAPIADRPACANRLPALDPAVLAELRALGGSAFVDELLEGFLADAWMLVGRIEATVAAGDMVGFRSELHALCSAGANIGAAALRGTATKREICQAELGSAGRALIIRIRNELARIERAWHAS